MAKKKDATQQGVSDDVQHNEEGDVVGTHTNERLSEIEEIAASRRAERDSESTDDEADAGSDGEGAGDDDHGSDTAGDTDQAAGADDDDDTVTLIVDGQEVKRKKSEVYEAGQRALQKESTADRRLEEATRLLREAEQRAQQNTPPSNQDAGNKSPSDGPDAIDYKQIVETIQYGDADEAAKALEDLIAQGRANGATQGDEKPLTREELNAFLSEKQAFDTAVSEFQKPREDGGFGELWEDPILRDMVIRKEAEKRDAGDTRPYGELFTEIGKELRDWLDGKTGKPNNQGLQDRQQKLKDAPQTPKPGGQRLPNESNNETKPKTRQEVIQEMAEARGQQL